MAALRLTRSNLVILAGALIVIAAILWFRPASAVHSATERQFIERAVAYVSARDGIPARTLEVARADVVSLADRICVSLPARDAKATTCFANMADATGAYPVKSESISVE